MTISVPCLPDDATARIQRALDDCFRAEREKAELFIRCFLLDGVRRCCENDPHIGLSPIQDTQPSNHPKHLRVTHRLRP